MASRTPREVTRASPVHDSQIVALLKDSFMGDPLSAFVWPDADVRRRGHEGMFRAYVYNQRRSPEGLVNVVYDTEGSTAGQVKAVSIWNTVDDFWAKLVLIFFGLRFLGLVETIKWFKHFIIDFHRACDQIYDKMLEIKNTSVSDSFAVADFLGADERFQGCGYGSSVMRHGIQFAQNNNKNIFLVSTNPQNVGFYQRIGFEVLFKEDFHGVTINALVYSKNTS